MADTSAAQLHSTDAQPPHKAQQQQAHLRMQLPTLQLQSNAIVGAAAAGALVAAAAGAAIAIARAPPSAISTAFEFLNLTTTVALALPSPSVLTEPIAKLHLPASFTLNLPPPRLLLELLVGMVMATSINVLSGALVQLVRVATRSRLWSLLCAALLGSLILPMPYHLPFSFSMPAMSFALLVFVGAWKACALAGGLLDKAVHSSITHFVVYFAVPIEYVCKDGQPMAATRYAWVAQLLWLAKQAVGFAMLRTVQELCKLPMLASFPLTMRPLQIYLDVWQIYFQLVLPSGSGMLTLALLGYQPQTMWRDPLTRGTSPSDFWSRRWNLLIHGLFRRTIFKPLVSIGVPAAIGAALAFLVSGLFHEYAFMAPYATRAGGLHVALGRNLAFFLLQAPVVTVEKLLGHYVGVPAVLRNSPVLCTLLTTLLLVPMSPLFMHPLHIGGVMDEGRLLMPVIHA